MKGTENGTVLFDIPESNIVFLHDFLSIIFRYHVQFDNIPYMKKSRKKIGYAIVSTMFVIALLVVFPVHAEVPTIATQGYVDSATKHAKSYADTGLATKVATTIFDAFKDRSEGFATSAQGTKADVALPLAGGTMTGQITLPGLPTEANHAASKEYVDAAVSGAGDSVSANMYAFGAYQGIYAGSMANWVPDGGASMTVKKIKSGTTGEIAVRVTSGQIVCIVPKDLTPSAYLRIGASATASDAVVQACPGSGASSRTCDADGLHITDNNVVILRQPPALSSTDGNWTLYICNFDVQRTRQPWDYNIMTYDGGVLSIGAHTIDMKSVAAGGSVTWMGGSI
jgi:hypothetical protein